MNNFNYNNLLNVPMEKWSEHGVKLLSCSANSDGTVNSFRAIINKRKVYGYRKHEFVNGAFTGKKSFVVDGFKKILDF